jgi:hypothetical protein
MQISNSVWLGRMQVFKPKKGQKTGIPVSAWHHLAKIDDLIIKFIWDTREIIDVHAITDLADSIETMSILDNGKALFLGDNSSDRAKTLIDKLTSKYPDLPIGTAKAVNTPLDLLREDAAKAVAYTEQLANTKGCLLTDDASTIFVPETMPTMPDMYMFTNVPTMHTSKVRYKDNNAYSGRSKYYAIIARCSIIKQWLYEN